MTAWPPASISLSSAAPRLRSWTPLPGAREADGISSCSLHRLHCESLDINGEAGQKPVKFFQITGVPGLEAFLQQRAPSAEDGIEAFEACSAQFHALGAAIRWIGCPLDESCAMQLGNMPG